jgi:hypothetical protein
MAERTFWRFVTDLQASFKCPAIVRSAPPSQGGASSTTTTHREEDPMPRLVLTGHCPSRLSRYALLTSVLAAISLPLVFSASAAAATSNSGASSFRAALASPLHASTAVSLPAARLIQTPARIAPDVVRHVTNWLRTYGKCSQYGYSSTGGSLPFGPHLWAKVCASDIESRLFGKICDIAVTAVGLGGTGAFVADKLCGLAANWAAGHILSHHGVWAEIYTQRILAAACLFPTIAASHDCSWNAGFW